MSKSKKKSPKISIIVPTHNNENYLEKCLDSLLHQTYREIEILCVDDGSEDETVKITEQCRKKDARIKMFTNPATGVSAARNYGIKVAKAKYIMFCDADDFYEPEACQKMLDALETSKASMVVSEINTVYEAYPERQLWDEEYYNLKFAGLQEVDKNILQQTDVAPTNKIFRKSIIDKHRIHFPEGRSYEDSLFCYTYFCTGKTIYYLNERLYNYVRHEGSTMANTWSKEVEHDVAIDHLLNGIDFYKFLKDNEIFVEYSDLFWDRFLFCENFAITESKTKEKKQEARNLATNFILEHKPDFYLADSGVRDTLIAINPRLFFIDASRTKKAILRFLPTYRLQIQNIWRLNALTERNNELLKELKALTKQINKQKTE